MAGLFRRLRRVKDAPAEEEPAVADPLEGPVTEGTVPEPAPELEVPAEEAGEPDPVPPTPEIRDVPEPVPPRPSLDPIPFPRPSPAASQSATPLVTGPPPPLPLPAEGAVSREVTGGPGTFHSCFLCGTVMDGPWCPRCRMVWND